MRGKRLAPHAYWSVSLGAAVALGLASFWEPAGGPTVCLFRWLLDLPCPGCGLSRAASLLLDGAVMDSLRVHPFALLVGLESAAIWAVVGVRVHRGLPVSLPRGVEGWALAHVAPLIAFWLGRLASGSAPF